MTGAATAAYPEYVYPQIAPFPSPSSHIYVSVEVQPGATHNAFWSIGSQMVRNEGVMSLSGGFGASMIREFVYSGMRMGTYEFFKDK